VEHCGKEWRYDLEADRPHHKMKQQLKRRRVSTPLADAKKTIYEQYRRQKEGNTEEVVEVVREETNVRSPMRFHKPAVRQVDCQGSKTYGVEAILE
jgi:hypothetical protein